MRLDSPDLKSAQVVSAGLASGTSGTSDRSLLFSSPRCSLASARRCPPANGTDPSGAIRGIRGRHGNGIQLSREEMKFHTVGYSVAMQHDRCKVHWKDGKRMRNTFKFINDSGGIDVRFPSPTVIRSVSSAVPLLGRATAGTLNAPRRRPQRAHPLLEPASHAGCRRKRLLEPVHDPAPLVTSSPRIELAQCDGACQGHPQRFERDRFPG